MRSTPRSGRSEAESLYGRRSGGYTRGSAPGRPFLLRSFVFNTFTPQQPKVTPAVTAHRPFRLEPPHSTRVDARKHVNASVCAVARCIPLALLTLTPQQPPVSLQLPRRVGSRTGATLRRSGLSVAPRFLWECLTIRTVSWFPIPAASNGACGSPALRSPVVFTSKGKRPM